MDREQIKIAVQYAAITYHLLDGLQAKLNAALDEIDKLSTSEKRQLTEDWQQSHQRAIGQLQAALACLALATTA